MGSAYGISPSGPSIASQDRPKRKTVMRRHKWVLAPFKNGGTICKECGVSARPDGKDGFCKGNQN
jgi:hypothetical protein